jgi:hypothetical protein
MRQSLSFCLRSLHTKHGGDLAAKRMQNPNDVTSQAFKGHVEEVASDLAITDKRMYELLARDNPYPKFWRIATPLGRIDPNRLELIRADFNARCDRLTRGRVTPSTVESLHKEVYEAVQKVLERAPKAERRQAIVEAIAELQKEMDKCDENVAPFGRTAS